MSQKIIAKRRKLKRIKRNKRRADRAFQFRVDNPDYVFDEYRKNIKETWDEAILDGEWFKDICKPISGWT